MPRALPKDLRIACVCMRQDSLIRSLWHGAQRYLRRVPGCGFAVFQIRPRGAEPLTDWRPHGILVHLSSESLLDPCQRLNVPMVNTSMVMREPPVVTVGPDNLAVGRLAAEHLLARGCRRFALLGLADLGYVQRRFEAFRSRVEAEGWPCQVYEGALHTVDTRRPGRLPPGSRDLLRWLRALESPTGILVADDHVGLVLCDVARAAGIDLARAHRVVSGHDRGLPCVPELTAVEISEDRWGYEAAETLVGMLRGEPPPVGGEVLLPPQGLIERESTERMAVADEVVSRAVDHIRQHVQDPELSVPVVAAACGLGRRALEKRFRKQLGRTVLAEIHRCRLDLARLLLAETDLTVDAVAEEAGLPDDKALRRLFARHLGQTPSAYRHQFHRR